jgi:predicted P-loop ATPase
LYNASLPFKQDPAFVDKFWFDKFQMKILVNGPLPWKPNPSAIPFELHKADELAAWQWLEEQGIPTDHKLTVYAIAAAAYEHSFHPIIDYLTPLSWSGVPGGIDTWTIKYLGVEDTPLVRAQSAAWMISLVARVYAPGCKADHVLVLEGEQGDLRRGKSSALEILGRPWYTDNIAVLGSREAAEQIVGRWLVELSELDAMRAKPSQTKSFISRRTDRFRWVYDPAVREYPRQCVFAATVNGQNWNRDPTGARRFWPMWCTFVDVDGLEAARDALFAEARDRYLAGEHWWIDDPSLIVEVRQQQELRYLEDPWEEKFLTELTERVASYRTQLSVKGNIFADTVSMNWALNILGYPFEKRTVKEQQRVAQMLQRQGWTRKLVPSNPYILKSKRIWRYVPPGYEAATRSVNLAVYDACANRYETDC